MRHSEEFKVVIDFLKLDSKLSKEAVTAEGEG
jgi:hypothetical protein